MSNLHILFRSKFRKKGLIIFWPPFDYEICNSCDRQLSDLYLYNQDFGPISEIVQQVVDWLTGRSQQISDRFSAITPPRIREQNNDKKETNIEDFLGKFSKTSKEVKCWFSVELPIEKSNIAGMETKGQFCGQKSKIVDPALIHPSPTHPPPSYEDQCNLF